MATEQAEEKKPQTEEEQGQESPCAVRRAWLKFLVWLKQLSHARVPRPRNSLRVVDVLCYLIVVVGSWRLVLKLSRKLRRESPVQLRHQEETPRRTPLTRRQAV